MHCVHCGYNLDGLAPAANGSGRVTCPECGGVCAPGMEPRISSSARWGLMTLAAVPVVLPAVWVLGPHIVEGLRGESISGWVMVGAMYLGMFWLIGVVVWTVTLMGVAAALRRGRTGILSALAIGLGIGVATAVAMVLALSMFKSSGGG